MTRYTQPANQAAFDQEHVDFALAVQLNFTSGIIRAHMGVGTLTIGGNDFLGVGAAGSGGFGSVSSITEDPNQRNVGELYLSLSGIDPTILGKVPQRAEYYNQFASIYFIPLDSVTMRPVSPIEPPIFEGFMDLLVYSRTRGAAAIQLTVKHYDSLFENTVGLLYTDESQKSLFSTDNFFDQIAAIANKKVQWGGTTIDPANQTPDTGHGGRGAGGGGRK
jgi:hypothetical protein